MGGLAEVVRHGGTAITVYPNDVGSLVWGIQHVLDHPDWSRQRAKIAYQMVVEQYNWQAIARKTIDVYQQVATERKQSTWV